MRAVQRKVPVSDDLVLPSAGPDPLSFDTALAAVLGYARGRRPLRFRSPSAPEGRWVFLPAFGYERFDRRPGSVDPLGEPDILTAEGLHGRLDPGAWAAMKSALDQVRPLADAVHARAAGRPFSELPDDEFSVLTEPGTVGALLREIGRLAEGTASPPHISAALHHRRPALFPLTVRATRWQLLPHVREGDSGIEAVVHREIRANRAGFGALQEAVTELLGDDGTPLTVLRLHDVLLWLSATLRLTHAVELGRATGEWRAYLGDRPGSRPA
jgi:HAMP domain-containing protein